MFLMKSNEESGFIYDFDRLSTKGNLGKSGSKVT